MKVGKTRIFVLFALSAGLCVAASSMQARADSGAQFELRGLPITPDDPKEEGRLVNELYSHYVDCLESVGNEEACYRRWWRECRSVFPAREFCPLLEQKMFPESKSGDESC